MKRALAERAKQSSAAAASVASLDHPRHCQYSSQNNIGDGHHKGEAQQHHQRCSHNAPNPSQPLHTDPPPSGSPSSSLQQQPPRKIPRVSRPISAPDLASGSGGNNMSRGGLGGAGPGVGGGNSGSGEPSSTTRSYGGENEQDLGLHPQSPSSKTEVQVRNPASRGVSTAVAAQLSLPQSSPRPRPSASTNSRPTPLSPEPGGGGPGLSPRPAASSKKRRRPSPQSTASPQPNNDGASASSGDEEDAEGDAASAFYLRHQNRALASELRMYRRKVSLLEAERDYRRRKCGEAVSCVGRLGEAWAGVEAGITIALRDIQDQQHSNHIKSEESTDGAVTKSEYDHHDKVDQTSLPSTGSGPDVETVSALLGSISQLSRVPPLALPLPATAKAEESAESGDGAEATAGLEGAGEAHDQLDSIKEKQASDSMVGVLDNVANRAEALRKGILSLICRILEGTLPISSSPSPDDVARMADLNGRIFALQGKCREFEDQVKELSEARDSANASERRVRRGLYRLVSGRMKIREVLKVVEEEDNGVSFMESFSDMTDGVKSTAASAISALASPAAPLAVASSSDALSPSGKASDREFSFVDTDGEKIGVSDVVRMKKNLQDLEEVANAREKKINELLSERDDQMKRINSLLLSARDESAETSFSEEDIKGSSLYMETAAKLVTSERQIGELKSQIENINERWAVAKGDVDLLKKSLEDLQQKHSKRWNELASPLTTKDGMQLEKDCEYKSACNGAGNVKHENDQDVKGEELLSCLSNAKALVESEHKLKQALESVRQAEAIRTSLADAHKMNEMLQSKLDELRTKNAALVAGKSASRASSDSLSPHASSHKSSSGSSGHSTSSTERLQREHRRMRKEVAAAVASKEAAKSKQERAEKERDSLMKINARLLKQSAEKDDMNAKSLSTILHVKHLTDEMKQEKEILIQKAKNAEQLALAARLAANAKDRVEEEAMREKKHFEEKLEQTQQTYDSLQEEKDGTDGRLNQSEARMASLMKDLNKARQRCDELAAESTAAEQGKKLLMESLAIAKREAAEAAKKAAVAAAAANASSSQSRGSVNSEFTMEQLTTQVSVLKSRLACPVCNDRDKKCILLRCRHMFCRQCVDENIKNRSRKCPACAQRFDTKDVGDVWL